LRPDAVFEAVAGDLTASGCIVRRETAGLSQTFFSRNAIPGERALFQESGKGRVDLVEIVERSPFRQDSGCPYYGKCGGCSLRHIQYDAQLAMKKRLLQDTWRRIAGREAPEITVHASAPDGSRNRAQFHRIAGRRIGFKAAGSGDIVEIKQCPALDAAINAALADGRIVPPPDKDRWNVYGRDSIQDDKYGGLYCDSIFLQEGGVSRGKVSLLYHEITLDAGVFFQSNAAMQEQLIDSMLSCEIVALLNGWLKGGKPLRLADLYCGVGVFAAFLRDWFAEIDLVEENHAALALARQNVKGDGLSFFGQKAGKWAKRGGNYDMIVADPPREGLEKETAAFITASKPPLFVYVSCNPATLARDARRFLDSGLVLESLAMFDFYPNTTHIECMAVFHG
jgi:23S rRNA (uracil1939-C5)-methyltransferase